MDQSGRSSSECGTSPSIHSLNEAARRHRLNGNAAKALTSTILHHATIVHGPPGTGKILFTVATMDAWASSLPARQS
eukprot:6072441-Pyramimonas_sp.AAC.1